MSETIALSQRVATIECEVDMSGRLRVVPDQIIRLGGGGLQSFSPNLYHLNVMAALGSQVLGYWPGWDAAGPTAVDISGNGRNGAYNGTYSLNQTGIGDGKTSVLFSTGVTTGLNVYSASLAAALSLDEGWLSGWFKMAAARWADASTYYFASLLDTGVTNGINMRKVSGGLHFYRRVGGTLPTLSFTDYPASERWVHVIFEWSLSLNRLRAWINGTPLRPVTTAQASGMGALSSSAAMFGGLTTSNTAQAMPGYAQHLLTGSGTLTAAQVRALAWMRNGQVVFDGDSRSNGQRWPGSAADAAYPDGILAYGGRGLASWATGGKTAAAMLAGAAEIDALLIPGQSNTLVAWAGVNDNGTSTAAQIYANLGAYCTGRKAAGWSRVILCTEIDAVAAGWTAKYQALNDLIRADHPWADAVADLGADARLQNHSDTTYFSDGTHLTAAGSAVGSGIVSPVLAS